MERQHFVVLIDPVGRGRKTEHPSVGDELAACGGRRARETVGRSGEKDRRVAGSGTSVAGSGTSGRKRQRQGERERERDVYGKVGKRDGRNRARE